MKKQLIQFAGTDLEVVHTEDTKQWFMTVEDVAKAYGVSKDAILKTIRRHREEIRDELELGCRQIVHPSGGRQESFILYREGVIKLGFFMRGERAKAFRQFATDLVVQYLDASGRNSPDGFTDLLMGLHEKVDGMHAKLDHLTGINLTVFGDDAPLIKELIEEGAKIYGLSVPEYWGRVRRECDVSSYKLQNRKIINWIRNDLGRGVFGIVKEEE